MSKKMNGLSRTKARSRQNLIDAFEIVFRKKPLEKISIKDITDAAGYNRSTFYLYFSDIYELADAYEDSVLKDVSAIVENIVDVNSELPLSDLIGMMGPAAGAHLDRIYLSSLLPGFAGRFRQTLMPLFMKITSTERSSEKHDYLLSLLSSILLHNIKYLHDTEDGLDLKDVVLISGRLIAPGLSDIISEL